MIKMKGPRDAALVSFDAKEYPVKKGIVEVPDEAAEALAAHGFVPIEDKSEAAQ